MRAVDDVLLEIEAADIPRILVCNKIDLLDTVARRRLANRLPDEIATSARTGEGIENLERAIAEHFSGRYTSVDMLVPHAEGGALSSLYALGTPILNREDTAEGVRIRASLPRRELDRYARFIVADSPESATEGVA
jgi:GTP-binding protein HflX